MSLSTSVHNASMNICNSKNITFQLAWCLVIKSQLQKQNAVSSAAEFSLNVKAFNDSDTSRS